jgi:hypothetical protein
MKPGAEKYMYLILFVSSFFSQIMPLTVHGVCSINDKSQKFCSLKMSMSFYEELLSFQDSYICLIKNYNLQSVVHEMLSFSAQYWFVCFRASLHNFKKTINHDYQHSLEIQKDSVD